MHYAKSQPKMATQSYFNEAKNTQKSKSLLKHLLTNEVVDNNLIMVLFPKSYTIERA